MRFAPKLYNEKTFQFLHLSSINDFLNPERRSAMQITELVLHDMVSGLEVCKIIQRDTLGDAELELKEVCERILEFNQYILRRIPIEHVSVTGKVNHTFLPLQKLSPIVLGFIRNGQYEVVDGKSQAESCKYHEKQSILAFVPIYSSRRKP